MTDLQLWYKNDDWMLLKPYHNIEWFYKYNFKWKCWTIAGIDMLYLIENGWSRKE